MGRQRRGDVDGAAAVLVRLPVIAPDELDSCCAGPAIFRRRGKSASADK
jgi:hypothetical protein